MDAQAQPDLTTDDGAVVAKTAGEMAAEAAEAAGGFRTGPPSPPVALPPELFAPESHVRIGERDVAADLSAIDPTVVASVARSDGRPGFTEQIAHARLVDDLVPNVPPAEVAKAERTDAPKLRTPPPRRNPTSGRILSEADRVIHGERAEQYGPAEQSFDRIARLWSVHLGVEIDAYDVAILMVLMKAARAKTDLKDDTFVDIAGYAALAPRCAITSGRTA